MTEEESKTVKSRLQGRRGSDLQGSLADLDEGLAEWADSFVFGTVFARPGLSQVDRLYVVIVAAAAGRLHNALRNYLHGALQDGMDPGRIHEALVLLSSYVGLPVATEAFDVWAKVIESERRHGLEIDLATALDAASPAGPDSRDSSPTLSDRWVDDFVFGTAGQRRGLSKDDRLLVSIIALTTLRRHGELERALADAVDAGVEPIRIHETLIMLCIYTGFPVVIETLYVWGRVVRSKREQGVKVDVPVR